jgi:hypothetical protein
LINCLTAIALHLMNDCLWSPISQPPPTLSEFLKECLDYSGKKAILVHSGAIQVISELYQKGVLEKMFGKRDMTHLRKRLIELHKLRDSLLESEMSALATFIESATA